MSRDESGAEVTESTGHGPFEDAVIHAFGDEIPAHECLSCGLKVAEGDEGFQLHSCQRIQRFNGKEIATDGGQEVSQLHHLTWLSAGLSVGFLVGFLLGFLSAGVLHVAF